jgi:hypothetical protein
VDGDRVVVTAPVSVVEKSEVIMDPVTGEVVDGREVLDIDEVVALLDSEEDMVLVVFDNVTSPAPSC